LAEQIPMVLPTRENDLPDFVEAARAYHHLSAFGRFEEPLARPEIVAGLRPPEPLTPQLPPVAERAREWLAAPLGALLHERTSARQFSPGPLAREALEILLWAAYGRVAESDCFDRRTAPSAGALYPLRLRLLTLLVDGVERGVYEYASQRGALERLAGVALPPQPESWFRTRHVDFSQAAVIAFITGDLQTMCGKYGERGYRYLLLEAGHAAQNICLAATALGVAHIPLGGFDDDVVNRSFGYDSVALYSIVLGSPQ